MTRDSGNEQLVENEIADSQKSLKAQRDYRGVQAADRSEEKTSRYAIQFGKDDTTHKDNGEGWHTENSLKIQVISISLERKEIP